MPSQAIAKRYDIFITAFEKMVAKKQKEITRAEAMQKPYEIARVALERAELPNDATLELNDTSIDLSIKPLPRDHKGFYDPLLKEIGAELKRFDFHPTGEPDAWTTSYDFCHEWKLRMPQALFVYMPRLIVRLDIPMEGTETIKIWEGPEKTHFMTSRDRKPYWVEDGEPQ